MKSVTKNKKSVSKTSKWLILLGFAFFITPNPLGIDITPDIFGCALVFFGLTQLAYFDSSVEEARKSLIYLFAVEAVHLLLMRSIFLTTINSNRLLAVTFLAITQGIVYIIIFKKLFSGISYFTMRNNYKESFSKCDSAAFLTYLSFFIRIAAMLIPELISILELRLSIEVDPQTYNAIASFVGIKPIIVLLLSAVALGTSVAWYVSVVKLFKTIHSEAGAELDERYNNEYTSRPEKVRPRKMRIGSYALYFSLIFALDISFDGIRFLPASAMFLFLFASTFIFKDLCDFKQTKKFALPSFVLLLSTEIFRAIFVPYGAIVIYETELWTVVTSLGLCLLTVPFCLLAVRAFLSDIRKLSDNLGNKPISTFAPWVLYCITLMLWSAGFVIPYFYPYISTLKLICSALFIWQTVKTVGAVKEESYERFLLYNK